MSADNNDNIKQELLSTVEKSPAAVAVHDKAAWMGIFAKYHMVEDPVGSTPHIAGVYDAKSGTRGNAALSRFFDTFIAPNQIAFDVKRDVVCGQHVVRDLTINIQMSPAVKAQVPMHLLYELTKENGEWRIQRLAAYWELLPMITQLLGKGMACLPVLSALTVRMLKLQGIGGMLGFSKAALNIGGAGKKAAQAFVDAFNQKDLAGIMATVSCDDTIIHLPYTQAPYMPSQLLEKVGDGQLSISKVMAAGDAVTASLSFTQGEQVREGVAIFEFNRKSKKIASLRCYL